MTFRSMITGSTALLAFACSSGSVPPPSTPPGPDVRSYRFDASAYPYRVVSNRQNNTVVQGQSTNVGSFLEVSVRISRGETGVVLNVDSVQRADGQVFDMLGRGDVAGAMLTAPINNRGHLEEFDLQPPGLADSPIIGQVSAVFQQFYPRLPGAELLPGTTWVDSTRLEREQQGADILVEAVTEFSVTHWSDTTLAGRLTVNWTRHYTITGAGEQLGQAFTIDGTGISAGAHYFRADGRYLGMVVADSSASQLVVTAMGLSLPITQLGADTIALINR